MRLVDVFTGLPTEWAKTDVQREDGLIYCSVCGEPRQITECDPGISAQFSTLGKPRACACMRQKQEEREVWIEKNRAEFEVDKLRRLGLTSAAYRGYTFANDDGRNPNAAEIARFYTDTWTERKSGKAPAGMLFFGDNGRGKSFTAGCIANAIIDRYQQLAFVGSIADLAQKKDHDLEIVLAFMEQAAFVVLDDLGAERSDSFKGQDARNNLFRIIDRRALSGRPTAFTTNLDVKTLTDEKDRDLKRIYDRVLGMTPIRVSMTGESLRIEDAKEARDAELASFENWRKAQAAQKGN